MQYVTGEPFADLTIEVIILTKMNPGFYFKVDSSELFLGNTFTVTLDGDGNGFYNVKLGGVTIDFQAVLAKVQITATTIGAIGTPDTAQYSKTTG